MQLGDPLVWCSARLCLNDGKAGLAATESEQMEPNPANLGPFSRWTLRAKTCAARGSSTFLNVRFSKSAIAASRPEVVRQVFVASGIRFFRMGDPRFLNALRYVVSL